MPFDAYLDIAEVPGEATAKGFAKKIGLGRGVRRRK